MDATPSWFALADALCSAAPSRLRTWSVASDCSNVVSHNFEGLFSTSADVSSPWLLSDGLPAAADQTVTVFGGTCRSVALPRRSGRSNPSARGRLLEMEHAAAVIILFCGVMQCMVAGFGAAVTGSTAPPSVSTYASLPSHRGAQVATIARTAYNPAPRSPRSCAQDRVSASDDLSSLDSKQWEKAFVDCAIVV
ncbi:hypothetical protein CFC21_085543 [Triticum aestivum]|uniref:Uncharacterized protein n=2 Tax=Triticum aestivum TaxID=4565 RepID=A0A9R1IDG9_WHEAT|nr:hypothetical protein CFC21_085543 [Triticum aestivum]